MKRKNLVYILIVVLVGTYAVFAYQYQLKQKETVALKLKIKLLEAEKKEPVSWTSLLAKVRDVPEPPEPVKGLEPLAETAATPAPPAVEAIEDQATNVLAREVDIALKNREKLSLDQLNHAIAVADELIQREPDTYSSYKAKLILLLTKEAAHLANISDDEVEGLLDEMVTFDVMSRVTLRNEAFLIKRTNAQIDALEENTDDWDVELTEIALELDDVEEGSPEETELLEDKQALEQRIDEQREEVERLEDELEAELLANEAVSLNEDIVEIPLQRGLAKGDYVAVMDEAESLLEAFGESIVPYFYLIRALELYGQGDVALDVIADSNLSGEDAQELERRLRRSQREDPKDYWKRLRF